MCDTKDSLIKELQQFEIDKGRSPTARDMRTVHGLHSYHSYRRAFGTWNNALKTASIKVNNDIFSEAEAISGERIKYVTQQLKISNNSEEFIKDMNKAYLIGAVMGDGCVNYYYYGPKRQHYLIQFMNTSKLFVDEVLKAMNCLGIKPRFIKREKPHKDSYNKKPIYQVQGNNRTFVLWFKNTPLKTIQEWLTSDVRLAVLFIKGFYEAEGSYDAKDRKCVSFVNTNKELIDLVKHLIEYLGFKTHSPYNKAIPSGKIKYDLRLSGIGAIILLDIINPCIKGRQNNV